MFRSTTILTMSQAGSVALGLVQMLILGHLFGTSRAVDAFFVAQSVPFFFLGLMEHTLNTTFLPVFINSQEKEGRSSAWDIARSFLAIFTPIFFVVSLILMATAPQVVRILAPGFSGEIFALTARMTRVMAPCMIFIFLAAFAASICFAYRRFLWPAMASLIPATGGILALLIFGRRFGIMALAVGLTISLLLQALFMLWSIKPTYAASSSSFRLFHEGIRHVLRLIGPRFVNASLANIDLLVDRYFASMLGGGFISALAYAQRITRMPAALLIVPLGKVMMPEWSRLCAQENYDEMLRLLNRVLRLVLFVLLPIMVFIGIYRTHILQTVLGRGRFDDQSIAITGIAILCYCIGFAFTPVSALLRWSFFSLQDTMTPLKIGFMASVANVILDWWLASKLGHAGIALGTSLVIVQNCILLWILFARRLGRSPLHLFQHGFTGILLINVLFGVLLWFAAQWTPPPKDLIAGLVDLTLKLFVGAALYLTIAYLLRIREVLELYRIVKSGLKLRRRKT